jgi:hypothetical protein
MVAPEAMVGQFDLLNGLTRRPCHLAIVAFASSQTNPRVLSQPVVAANTD